MDAAASADATDARGLAGLSARLDAWRRERQAILHGLGAGLPGPDAWPALPALGQVQDLWAGLRGREQVRRALQPAPADAGPLNSAALASRALRLMHEVSPGYLRHFTAYVDTLGGLEALRAQEASAKADAGAAPRVRRGKPRRGRGTRGSPANPD